MICFILYIFSTFTSAQNLTEFQAIQSDTEPEWIEIYNNSDEIINIDTFKIADSKSDVIYTDLQIKPFSFIVFTSNKSLLENKYILISNDIIELKLPTLNNTTDEIKIFTDGVLIDSLYYDMKWFKNGNSVERIDIQGDLVKENLANSLNSFGGTPLAKNSYKVFDYDVEICSFKEDSNQIKLEIVSLGRKAIEIFDYEIYLDLNQDDKFDTEEIVFSEIDNVLDSNKILTFNKYDFKKDLEIFGVFKLFAKIKNDGDEYIENDSLSLQINFSPNKESILINEFMFDVDDRNCEFIEIYNNSEFDINIKDLYFCDAQNEFKQGVNFDTNYILKSRDLFVLSSDSLIFDYYKNSIISEKVFVVNSNLSLNNGEDKIILKWVDGFVIDELEYSPDWHSGDLFESKNVSLEKKIANLNSAEKNNWISSGDKLGATPTFENTYTYVDKSELGLKISKNPFSFLDDNLLKITYISPFESSKINITLYSKDGVKLGMISELQFGLRKGEIIWDGKVQNNKIETGSYVLFFESIKSDTQEIYTSKELIVIIQ